MARKTSKSQRDKPKQPATPPAAVAPEGRQSQIPIGPDEARRVFLEKMAEGEDISTCCKAATISRETAYRWRRTDGDFRRQWDDAWESGTDFFEGCARASARAGDGRVLLAVLKARRREVWGDQLHITGQGNPFADLNDAQLNSAMAGLLRTRLGPLFARQEFVTLEDIIAAFMVTPLPDFSGPMIEGEVKQIEAQHETP